MSQAKIFETMEEIKKLEKERVELSNLCITLNERTKELAGNVTDIETQIATGKARVEAAAKEGKKVLEKLNDEIAVLESQKASIQTKLSETSDELESINQKILPLEARVEFLVSEKIRLEKEHNERVEARTIEMRAIDESIAKLKKEVAEMDAHLADAKKNAEHYTQVHLTKSASVKILLEREKILLNDVEVLERRVAKHYQTRKEQTKV